MTAPDPRHETALRRALAAEAAATEPRQGLDTIRTRTRTQNRRPGCTRDGGHGHHLLERMTMAIIARPRPLTLRVGQTITRHPDGGTSGRWRVEHPPVLFGETAEIEVRDLSTGQRRRFLVDRHDRVRVRVPARDRLAALLRAAAERLETTR